MSIDAASANADQATYWNGPGGQAWASQHETVDPLIRPIGRAAADRLGDLTGLRVLDVGCGCGETTLELAERVGASGSVHGVDISATLLGVAEAAARAAGARHARFQNADAQTEAFEGAPFDAAFSRFGVMFFADPSAAFANIRRAMRPGARLAFACWRAMEKNPFIALPLMAAAPLLPPSPAAPPDGPGPFAFADRDRVARILDEGGFGGVEIDPLDLLLGAEPLEERVDSALRIGPLAGALRAANADEALMARVTEAVRRALAPHEGADGLVKLPAAAWIVTARA
jgi:SAM-dependent methyltransferase